MQCVRRQLTGILLEVTNQELYQVASETYHQAKSKKGSSRDFSIIQNTFIPRLFFRL